MAPLRAAQYVESRADIRIVHLARATQQITLGEECGELRGERHRVELLRPQQHVREPRVHGKARHRLSVSIDAACAIERPETLQQVTRAREHRRRRLVQPGEPARLARSPAGEIQGERREIGIQDLGRSEGGERGLGALAPGAVADTGLGASGTALALLGGGARDALRLEAAHTGDRVEARTPHQSGVDHHAHAGNGEARLGDVGREHQLAHAAGSRRERRILRLGAELAVEGHHGRAFGACALEKRLHTADLTRAGQEHEHITLLLAQSPQRQLRDELLRRRRGAGAGDGGQERRALAGVARLDRKGAAGRAHPRCIAEELRHGRAIERRRHDEDAQLGCERCARIEAQREPEVCLQAALVELIEDDRGHPFERRILLQQPGEHALGHDLDARRARDARLEPHAIADGASGTLAEGLCHAGGYRARRDTARLEQQQALALHPGLIEQRQRDDRALTCAGRRFEHRGGVRPQGIEQRRQRGIDRQPGSHQMRTRSSVGR